MRKTFIFPAFAALAMLAFTAICAPPTLADEIYASPNAAHDIVIEFERFADAAILPAEILPGDDDIAALPAVAKAPVLSPVYLLSWKTDAHNLIRPKLRC